MKKNIAAFPLQMVCFPGERQNLHIFEERYRELTRDCINESISFAIVPVSNGKLYHLATEMELQAVEKEYDDGKFDITVKAVKVVRVKGFQQQLQNKSYPGIEFGQIRWNNESVYSKSEQIVSLARELYGIIGIDKAKVPAATDFRLWKIVHKIGLTLDQELELFSLVKGPDRQEYVINHLEKFIPTLKIAEELKIKAALNGHFKNLSSGDIF